jgi:cytochrome c553
MYTRIPSHYRVREHVPARETAVQRTAKRLVALLSDADLHEIAAHWAASPKTYDTAANEAGGWA